jgi:Outer membrane protein beta-barrel domain
MKKTILVIVAIFSMANFGNAQFAFGLKGGTNYSNEYDSKGGTFTSEAKFGGAAGVFLAIPLGSIIGFQPEILFSQKGFKATGSVLGSPYSLTRTTNFIDVPLMLAIKPVESFTVVLGPQYSYLMKQKDVFSTAALTTEQNKEFNNDNVRKNILGFVGGVDINLKNVVIGARVGRDFQNNNGDGTSTTPRYKNAWVQATLGVRIY